MMVSNRGSVLRLVRWQWRSILQFALVSLGVVLLRRVAGLQWALPALPLGVFGGALGIFVSFRTNSAYDRWWEGRKLWGRLINASRHLSSQALAYVGPKDRGLAEALVRRHIAYVHVLRCLLREQDPFQDEDVQDFLTTEEREALPGQSNPTHALLHEQLTSVAQLSEQNRLNPIQLDSMDRTVLVLLDVQGGCERIKKTPMPRAYGFMADRLIKLFAVLLPFAIVHHLGWLTVPVSVLVCLAFLLISEAGRVIEDPFTMFWNGLPLYSMSKTIERNLRERLGERDLPALPVPDEHGILM